LGLEEQQEALSRFAEAEDFEVVRTFIEVETGKGRVMPLSVGRSLPLH
jgi:hypothetical protein